MSDEWNAENWGRYPEIFRCVLAAQPVRLENDRELQLRSWIASFADAPAGYTLLEHQGWVAAIVWKGSAQVTHSDRTLLIRPCYGSFGWQSLTAGDVLTSDDSESQVIILSVSLPNDAPTFDPPLLEGVSLPLDSDDFTPPLVPFLRVIKPECPPGKSGPDCPDSTDKVPWHRGAIVVASVPGPEVLPAELERTELGDIVLVAVPKTAMLSFVRRSEEPYGSALVVDLSWAGDPEPVSEPGDDRPGPGGGCSWRCKG